MVRMEDLDFELAETIRTLQQDIVSLRSEAELNRISFKAMQGLSKPLFDSEFANMRGQLRDVGRQLIEVCDNLQQLFDKESAERRKDSGIFRSKID